MKVLITGTSSGIGEATARLFLDMGHKVIGIDRKTATIKDSNYTHWIVDVRDKNNLPYYSDIDILVNNAGTVDPEESIDTNLRGYINITEKYAFQKHIKAVVNVCSLSARTGLENGYYSASQGGRVAYSRHLAMELGKKYGATVNCISPGAVFTNLEPELYDNPKLMKAVAEENIFKKWIMPEEIAQWIYFVSVINKSMTGQDILIDAGEEANYNFIEEVKK